MTIPVRLLSRIAHAVHNAETVYSTELLGQSKKEWHLLGNTEVQNFANLIYKYLQSPDITPEQLHQEWMDAKLKEGWQYGPEFNEESKHHPCIVQYEELPKEERFKDQLLLAIIKPFAGL